MAIYLIDHPETPFVATQADIPKGQDINPVEVPTRKPELITFLNEMASFFRSSNPGSEEALAPENLPPSESVPTSPSKAEQIVSFEDQWENFPLALQAHYAALFCEEARNKLK